MMMCWTCTSKPMLREFVKKPVLEVAVHKAKRAREKDNTDFILQ
jgi:hypothetical protein